MYLEEDKQFCYFLFSLLNLFILRKQKRIVPQCTSGKTRIRIGVTILLHDEREFLGLLRLLIVKAYVYDSSMR